MWISVRSLAVLGQSGHFFKAAVARDGGRPVLLAVFCFQERGEVLLPHRPLLLFLSLGKMSVQFAALRLRFDAEDVNAEVGGDLSRYTCAVAYYVQDREDLREKNKKIYSSVKLLSSLSKHKY